jgi:hypothetical protein
MIQINGQYELADFKKAQALHARRGRLATWGVYYVIGLMALITGVGGVLAIMGRFPWHVSSHEYSRSRKTSPPLLR